MPFRVTYAIIFTITVMLLAGVARADKPLAGVKTVQVDPTVVPNADKVKEEQAPNQVADSLKKALRDANFEVGDAPIRAHIVLDEFTSGSTAKRVMVGFGAGRSTVDCHFIVQDAAGKELANVHIHVRGNLAFSPYEGNNTQRRQAVNSFEQNSWKKSKS